mgnify:FL=1
MYSQPRHPVAFWFTSNFLPAPLAIGFLGPLQGLTLVQSLLAILPAVLLASLVPAYFRALPVARMTLPVAVLVHVLHLDVLGRVAIHLLPGTVLNWQAAALALAALLALVGPPLLHRLQAVLAPLLAITFGVLTLGALWLLEVDTAQRQLSFSWSSFGLLALLSALWQIGLTPLAGRGLPSYAGIALPALWLMSLGALMASAIPAVDSVVSLRLLGERFFFGLGTLAVALFALAMVGAMAVHCHAQLLAVSGTPLKNKARLLTLAGFMLLVVLCNSKHVSLY